MQLLYFFKGVFYYTQMRYSLLRTGFCMFFFTFFTNAFTQTLKGKIFDENNQPLSNVNVFIKYSSLGTVSNAKGEYYLVFNHLETYEVLFSSVGYKTKTVEVTFRNREEQIKNVWLEPDIVLLKEMTVSAKRRDPAYDIMKQVIQHKDKYLEQYQSISFQAYIRASEKGELTARQLEKYNKQQEKRSEKDKKKEDKKIKQDSTATFLLNDTTLMPDTKRNEPPTSMKISELLLEVHKQQPAYLKEIKKAYKHIGSKHGLYYLSLTDGDFNFYHNLISVHSLSETPFISPLSRLSFLSYKFSLEETIKEEQRLVHKIKVWPWKKGDATMYGYVWIEDTTWAIDSLILTAEKGTLLLYDKFTVKQKYMLLDDSVRVLKNQTFEYYAKDGKSEYEGTTHCYFSAYQLNPVFPKKYFQNELGYVLDDANKRDAAFWNNERPVPLTREEQKYIARADSIYNRINSKEYLDSVDARFNKLTWGKIFYWGQGYRNRDTKTELWFGSVWDYVEPFQIGGMRLGPYINGFKKWPNEKFIAVGGSANIGTRNNDIKGGLRATFRYNPYRLSEVSAWGGHHFDVINPYDAFLNLIRRANFIEKTSGGLSHRTELVNGLYLQTSGEYTFRAPITSYKFGTLMDEVLEDNTPIAFQALNSVIMEASVYYTFRQKYIREPKRKVVLGSRWPTIALIYRKGVPTFLGSQIRFDYTELVLHQQFKLGTLGTSHYRISSGKFLETSSLNFLDYRYHRAGDPFLYSNPLYSFQLMKQTMAAVNIFYEAHYIHHFNGAFINNIPLLKKTRIQTVAGTGFLYMTDNNFRYAEVFAGIERTFRIARRRFRFGVYGVAAEASDMKPTYGIKFSIEEYNHRENRWRF